MTPEPPQVPPLADRLLRAERRAADSLRAAVHRLQETSHRLASTQRGDGQP